MSIRNSKGIFVLGFILLALLTGCPIFKPVFEGKVIDTETKAPIEGAIVVAIYEKRAMGLGAGALTLTTDVRETLTDSAGHFRFSHYLMFLIPFWHRESATTFIVFKPGYASIDGWNLEEYLSTEPGKEVELPWLYNSKAKFHFSKGVIGIPKIFSIDERWHASTIGVSGYTEKDLPLLYKTRDEEDKAQLIEKRKLEKK